jgi:hypothetical protein
MGRSVSDNLKTRLQKEERGLIIQAKGSAALSAEVGAPPPPCAKFSVVELKKAPNVDR